MGEFKFACPVCGQHITAEAGNAGTQIECPTCFKKLVVPQYSTGSASSFVLTASAADRPRANVSLPENLAFASRDARSRKPVAAFALLALLVLAATGAWYGAKTGWFRGGSSSPDRADSPHHRRPSPLDAPRAPAVPWTLDLAAAKIPQSTTAGRLHGQRFSLQRAVLIGGSLTLRQGRDWPPELGVTVNLFAKAGEELSNQTVDILPDRASSPRVTLRWKEADAGVTRQFTNGYALRVEFGQAENGRIPGKIFLAMPDAEKSVVAGTFEAEIRKPSPPKPNPPKPPKPTTTPPPSE